MKKIKKNKKIDKKEIKKAIPVEVRVAFGKYYIFSFLISLFLSVVYQFIVDKISFISRLLILIFSLTFYIYIFIDFLNHKDHFMATTVILCLMTYIFCLGFAIYKFILSC